MTKPTLDEIESLARKLCDEDGLDNDEISSIHPLWKLYAAEARRKLTGAGDD